MDEKERTIMYKVFDLVLGDPPANTSDANAWRVARAIELADTQDFDVFKLIARQNDVMHAMQDKIKKLEERNQLRGEFDIEGVIRFMEDDE